MSSDSEPKLLWKKHLDEYGQLIVDQEKSRKAVWDLENYTDLPHIPLTPDQESLQSYYDACGRMVAEELDENP